jgi:hypothetical protein
MKKLIPFLLLAVLFTGCVDLEYTTYTKDEVVRMMQKYQAQEADHTLPPTIKTFDIPDKITKALSKKGIRMRVITGALDASGKQMIILQLKEGDGTFVYINYASLKMKGEDPTVTTNKPICPPPADCIITIEDKQ